MYVATAVAAGDFIQDRLTGLNVRHYYYLNGEENLPGLRRISGRYGLNRSYYQGNVHIPLVWVVYAWDDGLDWSDEGESYQDYPPGHTVHSVHDTEEAAIAAQDFLRTIGNDGTFIIKEELTDYLAECRRYS